MTRQTYGTQHIAAKEQWRPLVESGEARCCELICLMPTRTIRPGDSWDLAHDRRFNDEGAYLGPAHAKCNRSEGARFGNAARAKPNRLEL